MSGCIPGGAPDGKPGKQKPVTAPAKGLEARLFRRARANELSNAAIQTGS